MKKVIRYEFASGWVLSREHEDSEEVDITAPLRMPEDLTRCSTEPVFGREFAVFLPREKVQRLYVGLAEFAE